MAKPLVLIGAGEFAQIACEYFQHDSDYEVVGFSVEQAYLTQPDLSGLPVVSFETLERAFPPSDVDAFDFSLGISTEREGQVLNSDLMLQKAHFGARAVTHDFYEWTL